MGQRAGRSLKERSSEIAEARAFWGIVRRGNKNKKGKNMKCKKNELNLEQNTKACNSAKTDKMTQFDWSRNWKKKVEPYLDIPLVRGSVEMGMKLFDVGWTWEDGPHVIGRGCINGQRVVPGKLSWYQPWGRCHWIAFFSCAIGVLNYPQLDWHVLSGVCHTVPVGSWNGENKVVMDILNFKMMNAEASIALTHFVPPNLPEPAGGKWNEIFALYVENVVPALRELAQGGEQ
jgi:hypothetical protein